MIVIVVVLSVLAGASNAVASVLQRRALRSAPGGRFRPSLLWWLVRRPVWQGGILALTAGFGFQAAALSMGKLSFVQPIVVVELPFTMLLVALVFRVRLNLGGWLGVGALTVGIAILLLAASPSGRARLPDGADWMLAAATTVGVIAALVCAAKTAGGHRRAILLGIATGIGFAFTAALIKDSTGVLVQEPLAVLTSWPLYAMIVAGLCSLVLLQTALHSGMLVAVQPAFTVSDPVASIAYGVALFGEQIRLGPWVLPELLGIGLILYGSVLLAQAPAIRRYAAVTATSV
jgi:drug/metabolite transporter (DMT)-like permease